MSVVVEVLLAALAVIGLLALGWFLFGRLLTPVGPGRVVAVIPVSGRGDGMEQTVKSMLWLCGGAAQVEVVLADMGLDEEGRRLAWQLCGQLDRLRLCPGGAWKDLLEE